MANAVTLDDPTKKTVEVSEDPHCGDFQLSTNTFCPWPLSLPTQGALPALSVGAFATLTVHGGNSRLAYWGKSLLKSAISPPEQTGHLGRRPANTNDKHLVWGRGNQSSFISAHWTFASKDAKLTPKSFSPLFFCSAHSLSSHSSHQRKSKGQGCVFPLQLCLPRFLYAVEMGPTPSITQHPLSRCRTFVGVSVISHNTREVNLPLDQGTPVLL